MRIGPRKASIKTGVCQLIGTCPCWRIGLPVARRGDRCKEIEQAGDATDTSVFVDRRQGPGLVSRCRSARPVASPRTAANCSENCTIPIAWGGKSGYCRRSHGRSQPKVRHARRQWRFKPIGCPSVGVIRAAAARGMPSPRDSAASPLLDVSRRRQWRNARMPRAGTDCRASLRDAASRRRP